MLSKNCFSLKFHNCQPLSAFVEQKKVSVCRFVLPRTLAVVIPRRIFSTNCLSKQHTNRTKTVAATTKQFFFRN